MDALALLESHFRLKDNLNYNTDPHTTDSVTLGMPLNPSEPYFPYYLRLMVFYLSQTTREL